MPVTWKPDTDDCVIEVSRGRFTVYFEDGRTDPAEVGFNTLQEAEDFVANSPKATGRPHRIEEGAEAGEPIRFVAGKASKVHPAVAAVLTENRLKNRVVAEVAKQKSEDGYSWRIEPDTREIIITLKDGSIQEKNKLEAELVLVAGDGKVRVV